MSNRSGGEMRVFSLSRLLRFSFVRLTSSGGPSSSSSARSRSSTFGIPLMAACARSSNMSKRDEAKHAEECQVRGSTLGFACACPRFTARRPRTAHSTENAMNALRVHGSFHVIGAASHARGRQGWRPAQSTSTRRTRGHSQRRQAHHAFRGIAHAFTNTFRVLTTQEFEEVSEMARAESEFCGRCHSSSLAR